MKTSLVFKVKSIGLSTRCGRHPVSLLQAARHNLREIQDERGCRSNINPALTSKNLVLAGPVKAVEVNASACWIKEKYAVTKRKLRKDHVQAIEFLISLPANSSVDLGQYFPAALDWINKVFGIEMVLSAVVHHDEAAPHIHVLILPIVDGIYKGGAPIDKTHLPNLSRSFEKEVGRPFGLRFEQKTRRTSGERYIMAVMVLDHVNKHSDPIMSSQLWQPVRDEITRSPESYFGTLGLVMPKQKTPKPKRTFTQIMTGKGHRTTEDRMYRNDQVLSCVGFPKSMISSNFSQGRPS